MEAVAEAMVGLHSSDPATVFLSARARVADFEVADLEAALYDRRSLVRILGMRRTLFVVSPDLAAVIDAACTRDLEPKERSRLAGFLEAQGIASQPEHWIVDVERRTLAALEQAGTATASQLREVVPELKERLSFGAGKTWAGTVGLSTRILFLLATAGRIVRARPRGTWLSSQYRWAPTADWLGGPLPELDAGEARRTLVHRWLATYGPGTLVDLRWWTGWTAGRVRQALAAVGALEVGLPGGAGYVLPEDLEPQREPEPWVALLPSLDPTVMGWKERDWYLGGHQAALFDRNGNAGPTVWVGGRVVGGWAQRSGGNVVFRLLEDVGAEAAAAVAAAAGRLTEWLGGTVVTPRFRAPLEKELVS